MEVDNETTREPPRFQMPIDRSTDGGAFAHWRHPASVWIAVDLAVIGLRAQALRAERAVGTGCGLCGIVGADLWAGRQCVGRLGAVLQGLAVGAPVAVVGLVIVRQRHIYRLAALERDSLNRGATQTTRLRKSSPFALPWIRAEILFSARIQGRANGEMNWRLSLH